MENLRTIPDALVDRAKAMRFQPWIHNSDLLFEQALANLNGDLREALRAYYIQGKNCVTVVSSWVESYCKSLELNDSRNGGQAPIWWPDNILDFAAGYGRVARHLPLYFPYSKIQTCDIHPAAVAFNAEMLRLESYQSCVTPEDLQVPSQDLILCGSFFTHIPKKTFFRWLKKLVSCLLPQGVLLFTTFGHAARISGIAKGIEVDQEGFGFTPKSGQRDLDPADYGTTISYPSYVLGLMNDRSDVRLVRFQEASFWGVQDGYMYAKK